MWGEIDQAGLPIQVVPTPGVRHDLPIALRRIHYVDNIDKHRVMHAMWQGLNLPPGFELKGSSSVISPLEDGAVVGDLQFDAPLPYAWEPQQKDMKRLFPLRVSIYEGDLTASVLEIVPFCLWGVESVLTLFQPVSSDQASPLPVAVIPNRL